MQKQQLQNLIKVSLSVSLLLGALLVVQSSSSWANVVSKFYNASVMKVVGICGVCSIPEGTNPSRIYDNFIVNNVEQNTNVYYFALGENQQVIGGKDDQLQVVIDQVFSRPTIIVISSNAFTMNIIFSITDKFPSVKTNFLANTQYILINSKIKATFKFKDESLASRVTVKYYCDDSCGSDSFISTKNANIWSSGGSILEFEMRQRIGANFTTFIGCERSSSFSFINPTNACSNGETDMILAIVLSVVLGGGCLVCLCFCCLSLFGCILKVFIGS